MKKILKIAGIVLLSVVGLAIAAAVLVRFCFRDEAVAWVNGIGHRERLEALRTSGAYVRDTDSDIHFTYRQDDARAAEIRDCFRLGDNVVATSDDGLFWAEP